MLRIKQLTLNLKFKIRNKVSEPLEFSSITFIKKTQIVNRTINIGYNWQRELTKNQKINIYENKTQTLEENGKLIGFYYNRVFNESLISDKYWKN